MGISQTSDHIQIKIKMPTPSQKPPTPTQAPNQDPPASSKAPNKDLNDEDGHCTSKIETER